MMTSFLLKGTNFSSWQKQGATEFFPKLFCSQILEISPNLQFTICDQTTFWVCCPKQNHK
jgi:hypothetical protein